MKTILRVACLTLGLMFVNNFGPLDGLDIIGVILITMGFYNEP